MTGLQPAGLLHSEIHGSMSAYDSPWHIAVNCVLLRLPVPRHSPCALCSLTIYYVILFVSISLAKLHLVLPICSFFQKFDFSLHITLCSVFKVQCFASQSITKSLRLASFAVLLRRTSASVRASTILCPCFRRFGGLKWTRTTDLALIRRAL